MQVDELLRVLQEEFALAAPEVDAALMQWLGHAGEGDARHAAQAAELYGRLAQACRLVSLEGLAIVLELLRDSAQVYAGMDGAELQEGLAWLVGWQPPVAAYLDAPGDEQAVRQVVDFLRVAPASPTLEQLDELALLLCRPRPCRSNTRPPSLAAATPPRWTCKTRTSRWKCPRTWTRRSSRFSSTMPRASSRCSRRPCGNWPKAT